MMTMTKAIYFDMDGTIANFYGAPQLVGVLGSKRPHSLQGRKTPREYEPAGSPAECTPQRWLAHRNR